MSTIAVINFGMGNLHSVAKALAYVSPGAKVVVTHLEHVIASADRVVFPGVGAIRDCMAALKALNLKEIIQTSFERKPFLAICVGMQALFTRSEENQGVEGLNLLPGVVSYLGKGKQECRLKIPHIGWNEVCQARPHVLWQNIPDNSRFYFVHSYAVVGEGRGDMIGETEYGMRLASALAGPNWAAVQFHPEKSQKVGLQFLKNFMEWRV
ncbi:MAG: imidazole glycerol phosphate synthase subunit HisH [Gammaproteobacteria bacterium]|nr:imidazole glycerol phosphate synthase subunit HisH [Gammaproteobacteria bacterium]